MDKKLQEYYENRFSMMATKGWHDFIEDVNNVYVEYNKVTSVSDTNSLEFRKGQLDILNWILSLHDVSASTYEELQNETNV